MDGQGQRWRAFDGDPDKTLTFSRKQRYDEAMKVDTVEIPTTVLSSVETLDELQDWLTAQNPKLIAELRAARKEDLAGKFKPWKPRHLPCPTKSK